MAGNHNSTTGGTGSMRTTTTHLHKTFSVLLMLIALAASMDPANAQRRGNGRSVETTDVWIGTGGGGDSKGIYHCWLDGNTGKLSNPTLAAEAGSPGFLAMHPTLPVLYAVCRLEAEPVVAAYRIPSDNRQPELELLNAVPIGDGGAAHVSVDQTGSTVLTAQYGGGSVAVFSLNDDGSLRERTQLINHEGGSGVVPRRQDASHAHWTGFSPDNRFAFVPDLGLDKVVIYKCDPKNSMLTPHGNAVVPPGSGPRHMKFHTSGNYLFVLNELALTISTFRYDKVNGTTELVDTVPTVSDDMKAAELFNSASEIRVHPGGRFVYSANRGHDTISVFQFDETTAHLKLIEHEPVRGATPRNFNIDPSGRWLLAGGQDSHTVASFAIDPASGELTWNRSIIHVPAAICILFEHE